MFPKSKELKCGILSSKLSNMTFILGARCSDGVVLIADRKITNLDEGLTFDYGDKLFAELVILFLVLQVLQVSLNYLEQK
jgi:hypothetical protein